MNADSFRMLYDYHISENRRIWDAYVRPLPQALFVQPVAYSVGSVRDQLVHLMNVDEIWFSQLRGVEPQDIEDASVVDRDVIRRHWDGVEARMRGYLATLRDDLLLHVANHGTDHRAQSLRLLHDHGVKTGPQDFVFYCYDHV